VVEFRQGKVGSLQNGLRVIESGIQPDDRVIVNGLQRARPGTTVKPHTEEKVIAASASPANAPKSDKTSAGQATPN